MKRFVLLLSFMFLTLTGCMHWFWFIGVSSPLATAEETVSPGGEVSDYDSFVDSLTATGATVERRGIRFDHACWFSVPAKRIRVNSQNMHVFEYDNAQAADADAALIAPDGGSFGSCIVRWIATPHIFRTERLIFLYVGEDAEILALLESVIGPQFAGG